MHFKLLKLMLVPVVLFVSILTFAQTDDETTESQLPKEVLENILEFVADYRTLLSFTTSHKDCQQKVSTESARLPLIKAWQDAEALFDQKAALINEETYLSSITKTIQQLAKITGKQAVGSPDVDMAIEKLLVYALKKGRALRAKLNSSSDIENQIITDYESAVSDLRFEMSPYNPDKKYLRIEVLSEIVLNALTSDSKSPVFKGDYWVSELAIQYFRESAKSQKSEMFKSEILKALFNSKNEKLKVRVLDNFIDHDVAAVEVLRYVKENKTQLKNHLDYLLTRIIYHPNRSVWSESELLSQILSYEDKRNPRTRSNLIQYFAEQPENSQTSVERLLELAKNSDSKEVSESILLGLAIGKPHFYKEIIDSVELMKDDVGQIRVLTSIVKRYQEFPQLVVQAFETAQKHHLESQELINPFLELTDVRDLPRELQLALVSYLTPALFSKNSPLNSSTHAGLLIALADTGSKEIQSKILQTTKLGLENVSASDDDKSSDLYSSSLTNILYSLIDQTKTDANLQRELIEVARLMKDDQVGLLRSILYLSEDPSIQSEARIELQTIISQTLTVEEKALAQTELLLADQPHLTPESMKIGMEISKKLLDDLPKFTEEAKIAILKNLREWIPKEDPLQSVVFKHQTAMIKSPIIDALTPKQRGAAIYNLLTSAQTPTEELLKSAFGARTSHLTVSDWAVPLLLAEKARSYPNLQNLIFDSYKSRLDFNNPVLLKLANTVDPELNPELFKKLKELVQSAVNQNKRIGFQMLSELLKNPKYK